jgi:hypothetical protein
MRTFLNTPFCVVNLQDDKFTFQLSLVVDIYFKAIIVNAHTLDVVVCFGGLERWSPTTEVFWITSLDVHEMIFCGRIYGLNCGGRIISDVP